MIGHNILHPLLITNFNIKFLEKDPTDQMWFSILLSQEIFDGCVIGVNNDLRVHDEDLNFSKVNTTASNSFSIVV
jgi:hypothetical protein